MSRVTGTSSPEKETQLELDSVCTFELWWWERRECSDALCLLPEGWCGGPSAGSEGRGGVRGRLKANRATGIPAALKAQLKLLT